MRLGPSDIFAIIMGSLCLFAGISWGSPFFILLGVCIFVVECYAYDRDKRNALSASNQPMTDDMSDLPDDETVSHSGS